MKSKRNKDGLKRSRSRSRSNSLSRSPEKSQFKRGNLLGNGEYGMVHQDATNPNNVIKTVLFTERYDQETEKKITSKELQNLFIKEGKIQEELGNYNIAPKIYYYGIIDDMGEKKGIIIMEKMAEIYRSKYPDVGDDPDVTKSPKLPPAKIQQKVIDKIIEMINKGYIHNDLHGGNIGFLNNDEVRLFDFGFSRSISPLCLPCNKDQLLGFSLYQLIEHLPFDLRNKSVYYDTIYNIRQNLY